MQSTQLTKTDRSTRRILVSALILLQLRIIHIGPVKCVNNHNSSRSNHLYGMNDGPPRFYANHRMLFHDEDRKENHPRLGASETGNQTSTLIHIDQSVASSMPRPQLALQIFTSLPPSNHRSDPPQPQPMNMTSNHQQPARLLNTMLLMPVSSMLNNHRRLSSDSNFDTTSGVSSASQRNYMIDLGSPQSKSSQWHYVTESQQPLLSATPDSPKEKPTSVEADNGSNGSNSPGSPLINAIITVPSQSEHHHHHHHQDHDGNVMQQSTNDNSSAAQIVDRTIAQLLDGQATGNIEFSMDLNGEEIVINPVRKHGRSMELAPNSTRDLLLNRNKLDSSSMDDDGDDSVQVALNGRRLKNLIESDHFHSPALSGKNRRHSSQSRDPIENQQSASEIDLVDESNDDGESGLDGEGLVESSTKTTRKTNLATREADRDQDRLDDEKSASDTSMGGDENYMDSGETLGEGRTQSRDTESNRLFSSPGLRKSKMSNLRTSSDRKQSRNSKLVGGKLALSGRRKFASKSDDSSDNQRFAMNRRDVKQTAAADSSIKDPSLSAVMIKGEDLRRLEQLLQSLRSTSMIADLPSQKQKQRAAGSQGQRRDYLTEDDANGGNFKREETEPRSTHQAGGEPWNDQDKNRQRAPSLQTDTKQTNKNELITLSDCERRRQEKQSSRVSTNDDDNGSYESDSSQEPVSEPNDEGNEKEEQGSDNYSSISLPVKDLEDGERPRSLFVRKTILQSYYDDNPRQPVVERDSSSIESNDEPINGREQREELVTSQIRPQLIRSYTGSSNGKLLRSQDSSRSENYIDYSKLDDRDVFRGLPSASGNRTYDSHHH